jgi:hypothetical protein
LTVVGTWRSTDPLAQSIGCPIDASSVAGTYPEFVVARTPASIASGEAEGSPVAPSLKADQTPCWSTLTAGHDTRMAKAAGAWCRPIASGTTQPPWLPP